MLVKFIVNPGAGPIYINTYESEAIKNIVHFVIESGYQDVCWRRKPELDDGGRFGFALWRPGKREIEIEMPGLPIGMVRGDVCKITDCPRLYVDGASWWWEFALRNQDEDWDIRPPREKKKRQARA